MKTINPGLTLLLLVSLFGCKKTITPTIPIGTAACKPTIASTNLAANHNQFEYTYDNSGKIAVIKYFIGGSYHVLEDSTLVGDNTIVSYHKEWPYTIGTVVYNRSIWDGMPTEAIVSRTEGLITQTDVFHYFFFYDSKNRLVKVGEQTDHVIGDWEYDLSIFYNDHDNVTELSYEWTTGPRTITTITALGYDDKPTPYAWFKKWYFLMHAAWNNYDPEPILTALSKNNPLGYEYANNKRTMTYVYGNKGFPTSRINTNTVIGTPGSYTFRENYDYQCK